MQAGFQLFNCSIVIPSHNHAKVLNRAISSLVTQTVRPREVIIVDDGSTDETRNVANAYGNFVRYIYQCNQGLSAARNAGLREATGAWVLFLDADDALSKDALAAYVECIRSVSADVYYGRYENLSADGSLINQVDPTPFTLDPFHQLLLGNRMAVHSVLARRASLLQAGGFDPSLKSHEDWNLWLQLALNGCRFQPVPGALAYYYRGSTNSMSRNYQRMLATGLEVLRRFESAHTGCVKCDEAIRSGRLNLRANCYGAILLPGLLHHLKSWQLKTGLSTIFRECVADPHLASVMLTHALHYIKRKAFDRGKSTIEQ